MKQYEYNLERLSNVYMDKIHEVFKDYGNGGWEYAGNFTRGGEDFLVFKKEKEPEKIIPTLEEK